MRVAVQIIEPTIFVRRSQDGSASSPVVVKGIIDFGRWERPTVHVTTYQFIHPLKLSELSKPAIATSVPVSLVRKWRNPALAL